MRVRAVLVTCIVLSILSACEHRKELFESCNNDYDKCYANESDEEITFCIPSPYGEGSFCSIPCSTSGGDGSEINEVNGCFSPAGCENSNTTSPEQGCCLAYMIERDTNGDATTFAGWCVPYAP